MLNTLAKMTSCLIAAGVMTLIAPSTSLGQPVDRSGFTVQLGFGFGLSTARADLSNFTVFDIGSSPSLGSTHAIDSALGHSLSIGVGGFLAENLQLGLRVVEHTPAFYADAYTSLTTINLNWQLY